MDRQQFVCGAMFTVQCVRTAPFPRTCLDSRWLPTPMSAMPGGDRCPLWRNILSLKPIPSGHRAAAAFRAAGHGPVTGHLGMAASVVAVWLGPHPEGSARDGGKRGRRWLGHLPREAWLLERLRSNGVQYTECPHGLRTARGSVNAGALVLLEVHTTCNGCLSPWSAEARLLWGWLMRPLNAFSVRLLAVEELAQTFSFYTRSTDRGHDGVSEIRSSMKGVVPTAWPATTRWPCAAVAMQRSNCSHGMKL